MADKKHSWNIALVITQALILIFIMLSGIFLGVSAGIIVFIDVALTGHMVVAAGLALVASITTIKTVTSIAEFFTKLFFPEEWAKVMFEKHIRMITAGLPPVVPETTVSRHPVNDPPTGWWVCTECEREISTTGTMYEGEKVCIQCYHVLVKDFSDTSN